MTTENKDTTKYEERDGTSIFDLIAQICIARNAAPLTRYPECWAFPIGTEWRIAVNGHDEAKHHNGVLVPEFHAYIEFNGWPFALLSPFGDGFIGMGSYANYDKLEADLQSALAQARGGEGA